MKELILGGVRSGKSRLAEQHAHASGCEVFYIATATADDAEMQQRIAHHRRQRPSTWPLIEEPLKLATTLQQYAARDRCLLVDCLTLWLTNLLLADDAFRLAQERDALIEQLPGLPGHIILVSNETGMGIVPEGKLARRFGDEAGRLHQDLAQICDRVILTVAGLPQVLKGDL
ncbi:Adenosylcobinamide kinase / Adenosylcobinamide-phosphate guanylyltransferase [hydrothermal vent metagenome]|uniref:Adenosylcobinamide kinase n=1 Tax=hydrothermal vent metagenome TaxID=652676 RepID=A0A3B1BGY0_9ZZZZ